MSARIQLTEHCIVNKNYDTHTDTDTPWSRKKFKDQLKINVVKRNNEFMEFDLINIDTSFVNGFRRILLSEIPCMAIEKVYLYNNTGVLQDEVLSHRLGLIPLKADARKFDYPPTVIPKIEPPNLNNIEEDDNFPESQTLQFELNVKYTKRHDHAVDPADKRVNSSVITSKHLKWIPIGDQENKFTANEVGPIHDDIIITKLAPGTEIDAKLFAFKGIAKDHAKFQTVGTAFYRLMPQITLLEEYKGKRAEKLKSCFSPGVIDIVSDVDGEPKAEVKCARYDSGSRNVFRYQDLKDGVLIERLLNHFIFTIESIGIYEPNVLFLEAIKVLENKCDTYSKELKENS